MRVRATLWLIVAFLAGFNCGLGPWLLAHDAQVERIVVAAPSHERACWAAIACPTPRSPLEALRHDIPSVQSPQFGTDGLFVASR